MIDTLWQDLKYAARSLRRTPGFAAPRSSRSRSASAPTRQSSRCSTRSCSSRSTCRPPRSRGALRQPRKGDVDATGGTGRYLASRTRVSNGCAPRSRSRFARGDDTNVDVRRPFPGTDAAESVRAQLVSAEHFSTLEVPHATGRTIGIGRPPRRGSPVAVIGERLWKERLGGADVLGESMIVSGVSATIVGIAPPGFIGAWSDARADLWLPLTMQQTLGYRNNVSSYGDVEISQPWCRRIGSRGSTWSVGSRRASCRRRAPRSRSPIAPACRTWPRRSTMGAPVRRSCRTRSSCSRSRTDSRGCVPSCHRRSSR